MEKLTVLVIGPCVRLQLITQINIVKRCMQQGHTVVLMNHDNIYEALYDILNQRYVLRRNEKRGTVQKLLRLAVGTRSQLCEVHPRSGNPE